MPSLDTRSRFVSGHHRNTGESSSLERRLATVAHIVDLIHVEPGFPELPYHGVVLSLFRLQVGAVIQPCVLSPYLARNVQITHSHLDDLFGPHSLGRKRQNTTLITSYKILQKWLLRGMHHSTRPTCGQHNHPLTCKRQLITSLNITTIGRIVRKAWKALARLTFEPSLCSVSSCQMIYPV